MHANLDKGFFSLPWPNDVRTLSDGSLDTSGLPGSTVDPLAVLAGEVTLGRVLLPEVLRSAGRTVDGFGANSALYMQSSVPIDPATLPDPVSSVDASSEVMLMDLDHGNSPAPVLVETRAVGNRFRPANSLIVLPYPGHPLKSATRYALVVFDGVRSASGNPLEAPPLIEALDDPWSPELGGTAQRWEALRIQRDATRAAVVAATDHDSADIVAFSVFTTQDLHRDMAAVASTVRQITPPELQLTATTPCGLDWRADFTETALLRGTLAMPRFQRGAFPYLSGGGEVEIGPDGLAVVQSTTDVPVEIRVPCSSAPAGGWPAVGFVDGTGSDGRIDSSGLPFGLHGRVVAEIPPLYGGVGLDALDPLQRAFVSALGFDDSTLGGLLFYNLLNPTVARSNVFQQAADHLVLTKALRSLSFDTSGLGGDGPASVDPARVSASGHSQGASTLPMVAWSDPEVASVVSSSGSAGYYHAFAHTADKRFQLSQLTGDIGLLDELNPMVQVAQTVMDAADPANYPSSVDYLNVAGRLDGCVGIESARHLAGATGLDVVDRQEPSSIYGSSELDATDVTTPVSGNRDGHTRVSIETAGGHYVATSDFGAGTAFLDAIDAGSTPTITANAYPQPNFLTGCSGRWDDPTNRFGE